MKMDKIFFFFFWGGGLHYTMCHARLAKFHNQKFLILQNKKEPLESKTKFTLSVLHLIRFKYIETFTTMYPRGDAGGLSREKVHRIPSVS